MCDNEAKSYWTRLSAFPCGCFRSSITLIKPVYHFILIALLLTPCGAECSCSFIQRRTLPPPPPLLTIKQQAGTLMVGFHLKHLSACNTWQTGAPSCACALVTQGALLVLQESWFSRPFSRTVRRTDQHCCVFLLTFRRQERVKEWRGTEKCLGLSWWRAKKLTAITSRGV